MAFDIDEAQRVLKDFETFMRTHKETRWADLMMDCKAKVAAVGYDYEQAINVFVEYVDAMWGGAMGGGLFEFLDDPAWQKKPRPIIEEFQTLWNRLGALLEAAKK